MIALPEGFGDLPAQVAAERLELARRIDACLAEAGWPDEWIRPNALPEDVAGGGVGWVACVHLRRPDGTIEEWESEMPPEVWKQARALVASA